MVLLLRLFSADSLLLRCCCFLCGSDTTTLPTALLRLSLIGQVSLYNYNYSTVLLSNDQIVTTKNVLIRDLAHKPINVTDKYGYQKELSSHLFEGDRMSSGARCRPSRVRYSKKREPSTFITNL